MLRAFRDSYILSMLLNKLTTTYAPLETLVFKEAQKKTVYFIAA